MGVPVLVSAVFCGFVLFRAGRRSGRDTLSLFPLWAGLLLAAGLTLRLVVGYHARGFTSDMDTFKAWAYALNNRGFKEIYHQSNFFVDYPPGYLYVLLLMDKLREALNISFNEPIYTLMLKLPSIGADLLCAGCLLWVGRRKLGEPRSLLIAAFYLFCPALWVNSAQWGQVDSFCTAILLASVLLLYEDWYIPSGLLFGLSIACKPQMIIFAPLYLFFAVKEKKWLKLLLGIVCTVGAVLVTAVPFAGGLSFGWLIEKYKSTLDYYNFYSINAYNFWTVIGWNWKTLPGGLSLTALTFAAPLLATALCGAFLLLSKQRDAVFACPVLLMTVMYLFGIKMHERYLYPIFLFLLLAFLFTPDKRLLRAFAVTSLANYLNVAHVLYLFKDKGGYYDPNAPFTRCLAALQLLALGYGLYVLAAVYVFGPVQEAPIFDGKPRPRPAFGDHRLCPADLLAMAVIVLLYGTAAFWDLGGRELPISAWAPDQGDQVVLEAGGECEALLYLPGLAPDGDHRAARTGVNIAVESSDDGVTWTDCGNLNTGSTYVFSWARHKLSTPGRYLRLRAEDGVSVLNEVGAKVLGRTELISLTLREGGSPAQALVDEQAAVPLFTTYENSTYFDEIYHARTAYEHILGLEPYENTHPPLGKYIISLGIRLFGMDPFGWRFMGTLFGVLMLPVLYHLLKQLFGKTSLCCAGTLLFAFDFMHFTQTRIATIDTYSVFFLLLMYDAMTAFLRRDVARDSLKKLLVPLFLSGIFTGLGIASKWTAAYGALGLAALYFGKLYLTWRDERAAGAEPGPLLRRMGLLCAWCCLFFVVIPFGLYFAAYLPLCTLPHNAPHLWWSFTNYQKTMFEYHSKLVAEHYFASPWYEWPFVVRPIWYFSNDFVDLQGHYSTIAALGNPLLWWAGVPALLCTALLWARERRTAAAVVLCGFLSVYLPWVLVPRLTFIYHYFTAVPFLTISLCGVFDRFRETCLGGRDILRLGRRTGSLSEAFLLIFTAACVALFFVYYPVLSGAPTSKSYTDALRLFKTWYF